MTGHDPAAETVRAEPAAPHAPLAATRRAERALDAQRARHQPDDAAVDEDGVGAIVVNTGLDGDAASG